VSRQFDFLVAPFGGPVHAGNQTRAVDTSEVAVAEAVPRLRLLPGPFSKAEVPLGVLVPGVGLEERVLGGRARLHVSPVAIQNVLARVDEPSCPGHRAIVKRVRSHGQLFCTRGVRGDSQTVPRRATNMMSSSQMRIPLRHKITTGRHRGDCGFQEWFSVVKALRLRG
jgi:hypothetical protein